MRIGVGITTFERFDRFKECFENLLRNSRDIEEIVIVDDASIKDREKYDDYFKGILTNNVKVFINEVNSGVGVSKNKIMKYFYEAGYDYFFTLEDDINIISPDAFVKYIECSQRTDLDYINFALHGDHNKIGKLVLINGFKVKLYPNIVGALTLYTPRLIETIGYHDEKYINAMEHVDYTYMASLKGLTTKFGHFIDLYDSANYVQEQPLAIIDSSIRPRSDWKENVVNGIRYFKQKHGVDLFELLSQSARV